MFSKKTVILISSIGTALLATVGYLVFSTPFPSPHLAGTATQSNPAAPSTDDHWNDGVRSQREALFSQAAINVSQPVAEVQSKPTPAPGPAPAPSTGFAWPDENLVPTVYAAPDPNDPVWTPEALDKLRLMREWFDKAAEPLKQMDSNSPEYYTNWKVLQDDFDEQFRTQFGNDAFIRYEQQQERAQANAQP